MELAIPASQVDVRRLQELRGAADGASLREATELCRGELLADTSIQEEAFAEWLRNERQRFNDLNIAVFEAAIPLLAGPDGIALGKRLIALNPLREASHRCLMQAFHAAGETAQALRQYDLCRDTLKIELGVAPAAATQELRRSIAAAASPSPVAAAASPMQHPATEQSLSLAVMPFHNLSGDVEQRYLSDGLTEDLTTDLSKIPGLVVIAAYSTLQLRSTESSPAEAARTLGVRHILQGRLRRIDSSIGLNIQLIDTSTGQVTWADRFDSRLEDFQSIHTEIVRHIAQVLTGASALPGSERYRPKSLEALDLVMRARSAWRFADETGYQAMGLLERAIELEPGFPEAHRWLCYGKCMGWLHFGAPLVPYRAEAVAHAEMAVASDPGDAANHTVLAFVLLNENRLEIAEQALQTALRLNPNEAEAWFNLSDLRVMEGKGAEAVACSERSLRLNPQPNASYYWLYGQAQIAAGQLEAAVATLRREETYRSGSRRFLAAALALLGRLDEAREEGLLFMAAYPHFRISYWVQTQPFRDLAMRDRFVSGYRLAGLPD